MNRRDLLKRLSCVPIIGALFREKPIEQPLGWNNYTGMCVPRETPRSISLGPSSPGTTIFVHNTDCTPLRISGQEPIPAGERVVAQYLPLNRPGETADGVVYGWVVTATSYCRDKA